MLISILSYKSCTCSFFVSCAEVTIMGRRRPLMKNFSVSTRSRMWHPILFPHHCTHKLPYRVKAKLHYCRFGLVFSRIVSSSFWIVSRLSFPVNFNPISFSFDESSMWSAWLRSPLHLPLFSAQKLCGHF